jgi:hypothetical protein
MALAYSQRHQRESGTTELQSEHLNNPELG